MQRTDHESQRAGKLPIAFLGTYPPSLCGIGTFTNDLSDAVISADEGIRATVLAMTGADFTSEHPERVRFQIRRGIQGDYARAADFVNHSDIRMVSVQHEYGIFGGTDGAFILDFLAELRKPSIATLHTVLDRPSKSQRAIVRTMAERCECLVVMSRLAVDLLVSSYSIPREAIRVIPHGIPEMRADAGDISKAQFGLTGRRVLLTFGLLSSSKGIEVVIRALPSLVDPRTPRSSVVTERSTATSWSAKRNRSEFVTMSSSGTSSSKRPSCAGISRHRTSTSRRIFKPRRSRAARWRTPWGPGRPLFPHLTGMRRSCWPRGVGICSTSVIWKSSAMCFERFWATPRR
jgi:hypothetical protein